MFCTDQRGANEESGGRHLVGGALLSRAFHQAFCLEILQYISHLDVARCCVNDRNKGLFPGGQYAWFGKLNLAGYSSPLVFSMPARNGRKRGEGACPEFRLQQLHSTQWVTWRRRWATDAGEFFIFKQKRSTLLTFYIGSAEWAFTQSGDANHVIMGSTSQVTQEIQNINGKFLALLYAAFNHAQNLLPTSSRTINCAKNESPCA